MRVTAGAGVIILAGALGVLAWWLLSDRDDPSRDPSAARKEAPTGSDEERPAERPERPGLTRDLRPVDTAPFPQESEDDPRCRVLIVLAENGRPAASAAVQYALAHDASAALEDLDAESIRERLFTEGRVRFADARGLAILPPAPHGALLRVRKGARSRTVVLPAGTEGTFRVALPRPRKDAVYVLGADGTPCAGVRLSLVGKAPAAWMSLRNLGTSDDDGVVEVNIPSLLESPVHAFSDMRAQDLAIAPRIFSKDPPHVHLVGRDESAPIVIQLPPLGSIAVEVTDPSGQLLEARSVTLTRLVDDWPALPSQVGAGLRTLRRPVRDGRAVFEHVGVGLRFRAAARMKKGTPRPEPKAFDGPRAAEAQVEVRLSQDARAPVVSGTLVDEDGDPLVNLRFVAGIVAGEGALGWLLEYETVRTDENGRFTLALRSPVGGVPDEAHLLLTTRPRGNLPNRTYRARTTTVHIGTLAPGNRDLGEIELPKESALVAGTVVDEAGVPIKGARVDIQERRTRGESIGIGGAIGIGGGRSPVRLDEVDTWTDDDGRFAIYGRHEPDRHEVIAALEGTFLQSPRRFRRGQTDLVLRLRRAGSLQGSLADPKVFDSVHVAIIGQPVAHLDTQPDGGEPWILSDVDPGDGTFHETRLKPGLVTVEVRLGNRTLASVRGVRIVAGEPCKDPRLQGIRVAGLTGFVTVTVVDKDRAPVGLAIVSAGPPDWSGAPEWSGWTDEDGTARVPLLSPGVDVVVRKDGYRPRRVDGLVRDRTVMLRPALVLRLTIPGGAPRGTMVAAFPAHARVPQLLKLLGNRPGTLGDLGAIEDVENGTAELQLSEPGRWRVYLVGPGPTPAPVITFEDQPLILDVPESAVPFVGRVDLTAEQRAALAR